MNSVTNPSFKSVYKVTMPNVQNIKDENEKDAVAEAVVNTVAMGFNYSEAEPRISKDHLSVYYKINNKNDAAFESGFKNIIDGCNKQFNMDLAKKVYYEKSTEEEFKQAEIAK